MSGDNLIDNMSTKFRKLKNAENAVEKQELIAEIRADADILTKYL